jgi:multiple sugar transport system ATP-binding protein
MVFQNYALYPQKTVADNMAFALKMQGVAKKERYRRVRETAVMLELEDLLDRKPKALSGGQRQRVAMGRAIVREPRVFLMDEPLSNLDAKLRVQTRSQIAELQRRIGVTTVYVTHDQVEAMTMGTRVAVLHNGQLQQFATPRALYDDPVNLFVAGFIGSPAMNLCTVHASAGTVRLGGASVTLPPHLRNADGRSGPIVIGIRPEHLHLGDTEPGSTFGGQITLVEELGADSYLHVRVDGQDKPLVVRAAGRVPPRPDEQVSVGITTSELFAFDPETGSRLGQPATSASSAPGPRPDPLLTPLPPER